MNLTMQQYIEVKLPSPTKITDWTTVRAAYGLNPVKLLPGAAVTDQIVDFSTCPYCTLSTFDPNQPQDLLTHIISTHQFLDKWGLHCCVCRTANFKDIKILYKHLRRTHFGKKTTCGFV